jgi:hypothetical protein
VQAAAAALEANWLKLATLKELELLELSGERPDLFANKNDGELRVLFHPAMGLEPVSVVKKGPVAENASELVFRRTRLRTRLGLPAEDCGARKPNRDCTCLTAVLDELGAEGERGADKESVLAAARKRRIKPERRWHRPRKTTPVAPPVAQPAPVEPPIEPEPDP